MFRISGLGQIAWDFCLLLNGEIHNVEIQLLCLLGSVSKVPQVLPALLSDNSNIKVSVNWVNDNGTGNPKYSEKNLFQCHFVHYKLHMDWPAIESGPSS
jgi:hypothetical protein